MIWIQLPCEACGRSYAGVVVDGVAYCCGRPRRLEWVAMMMGSRPFVLEMGPDIDPADHEPGFSPPFVVEEN